MSRKEPVILRLYEVPAGAEVRGALAGQLLAVSWKESDPGKFALLRALKHVRQGWTHSRCPVCVKGDLCEITV